MARNRKTASSRGRTFFGRANKRGRRGKNSGRRLSAYVSEEHDWQTEVPNLKLSRAFGFVLALHVVAVGGILAYEIFKEDRPSPRVADSGDVAESGQDASLFSGSGAEEDSILRQSAVGRGAAETAPEKPLHSVSRQGGRPPIAAVPVASDRPRGSAAADSDGPSAAGRVLRARPYRPAEEGAASSSARPLASRSAGSALVGEVSFFEYTVVKGDTLYGLGRRHGVVPDAIRKVNGLKGDEIRTGQVIRIPRRAE